ncbi:MAG: hypothetical protein WC505_05905 [Patescibacteria group bacterium]
MPNYARYSILCGPCPRCPSALDSIADIVWPKIDIIIEKGHDTGFARVRCPRCGDEECVDTSTTIATRDAVATAILNWNAKHWPGTSFCFDNIDHVFCAMRAVDRYAEYQAGGTAPFPMELAWFASPEHETEALDLLKARRQHNEIENLANMVPTNFSKISEENLKTFNVAIEAGAHKTPESIMTAITAGASKAMQRYHRPGAYHTMVQQPPDWSSENDAETLRCMQNSVSGVQYSHDKGHDLGAKPKQENKMAYNQSNPQCSTVSDAQVVIGMTDVTAWLLYPIMYNTAKECFISLNYLKACGRFGAGDAVCIVTHDHNGAGSIMGYVTDVVPNEDKVDGSKTLEIICRVIAGAQPGTDQTTPCPDVTGLAQSNPSVTFVAPAANPDPQPTLLFCPDSDDLLVLYLPHRGPDDPEAKIQPVLRVKRWGEVTVVPGWKNRMDETAMGFWRALAHVYRSLPLPVSPKQEAIIKFCTNNHMTLAEFDAQYYARPARHMEVVDTCNVYGLWVIEKIYP